MAKTIKSTVTKKKTTTELPMYLQPKIKEPIKYMKKSFKKNKKEYVKFLRSIDKGKSGIRGVNGLALGLNKKRSKQLIVCHVQIVVKR
ncbi:MAG: hypothetical protein IPH33_00630 [Bacteroidetes bacterium]|nr:hypothetical protein [Bacteroidota bacterium]